jgi:hypothetical protein
MGAGSFWLLATVCAGWFTLSGRMVFDSLKEQNYQTLYGWTFCALLPTATLALLTFRTNPDMLAKNLTLGLSGAVLGASGLIWLGYLTTILPQAQPSGAPVQPLSPSEQTAPPSSPSPMIYAPNNSGIITSGQAGDNRLQELPH